MYSFNASMRLVSCKYYAGRAGRRNSQFPQGYATCLDPEEVPALKAAMRVPQWKLKTPAAGKKHSNLRSSVLSDWRSTPLRHPPHVARWGGLCCRPVSGV